MRWAGHCGKIKSLTTCGADANVRAIVITGAGRGFCSGGDVKAMSERDQSGATAPASERFTPIRDRIILAMRDCPKPIIAAVNGAAAGAGMNLALACDMRIASTAAKFSQAFVKRGLHPDFGWHLLPAAHRRHREGVRAHFHGGLDRCR